MTEKSTTVTNLAPDQLVDYRLVMWHFWAALLFLFINMVAGLLVALQLVSWNPFNGIEFFSPGRWRMVHTNAVAYGFLANAFLGVMHWVIPRLTLRPVLHPLLSMLIFIAWQLVVLATAVGILFGEAQAVEWGETPVWVDPVALLGLFLVALNFMPPIARSRGPMYVTNWYFLAMFIWTFLTYAMGNFIPQYVAPGTAGGAVAGLFIHDLVGLFVTPLGWGSMYFFVPILLKNANVVTRVVIGWFLGLGILLSTPRDSPLPVHTNSDVLTVWCSHFDNRRRTGGVYGDCELLWNIVRQRSRSLYQHSTPLVLLWHGQLFYHLLPMCSASDDDLPRNDPLQRLGRRACSLGHVWCLHDLADGDHDVSNSTLDTSRMVQQKPARMALLAVGRQYYCHVPGLDAGWYFPRLSLGQLEFLGCQHRCLA